MTNDAETIKSILIFAAGVLGFAGAVITFVNNSRLKEAKTVEAKYRLYIKLFSFLEGAMWLGVFLATGAFGSLLVGLWFMGFACVIHCGLFLAKRTDYFRQEVLMLVVSMTFLIFMLFSYLFGRLLDAQSQMVKVEGKLIDTVVRLTDDLKKQ